MLSEDVGRDLGRDVGACAASVRERPRWGAVAAMGCEEVLTVKALRSAFLAVDRSMAR